MKKIKNLNDELDNLLSKTILPSDEEIKYNLTIELYKQNGRNAVISGQLRKAAINGGKKQGKKTGKLNVKSGHLSQIRKLASSKESRKKAVSNTDYKSISEKRQVPIFQFSMDGKFIAKYKSVKDAAEKLGIQSSNITNAAKGRYPHYKKFIWKYKK